MLSRRKLGNTDIELSLLGLGTVKFGRNTAVKYPTSFDLPDTQHIIKLLDQAKELGVNTLDTAPAYGSSEQRLGNLFKDKHNNIARQNWVLITKAGEDYTDNISTYNFDADYISNSLDNSLRTLGTDYIDIFLIHSDGSDQEIADNHQLWELLAKRKQQGDIRAYGVSSKTVNGGLSCLKQADCAMITYRPDYQDEKPLLDYAAENNKGILLKKVLNSGHAALDGHNLTTAESLKFSSNHSAVNSMIVGTINMLHLQNNISALS